MKWNMRRFACLMRWVVVRSKKSMVIVAASFAGLLLFLMGMAVLAAKEVKDYHIVVEQMSGLAIALFFMFLVVSPSFIMANCRRRQGALAYFSLPASSLEKYVARFILVTVVWGGCLFIGFLAFDLIQYLIASIVAGSEAEMGTFSYVFGSTRLFNIDGNSSLLGMLLLWITLLWFQSIYALGGTFLRRFQWLAVSVILLAGMIIFLSWSTGTGARAVAMWLRDNQEQLRLYGYLICGGLALCVAFNYRLSLRFFQRSQVIQNKWFNI